MSQILKSAFVSNNASAASAADEQINLEFHHALMVNDSEALHGINTAAKGRFRGSSQHRDRPLKFKSF